MKLLTLMWPGIKRQWRWLVLGMALILLSLISATVLLGLSGWFITASALAGLGMITALDIFTPGAGIRLAALTRTAARYGERLATHETTFRLLAEMRQGIFARLLEFGEFELRQLRRGETLNRLTRDVETLDHFFTGFIGPVFAAILLTLGVVAAYLVMGAAPAAVVVLSVLALNLLAMGLIGHRGARQGRQLSAMESNQRILATEAMEAMETLQAFDQTTAWRDRMAAHTDGMIQLGQRLARLDRLGQGLITLFGFIGLWFVLIAALGLVDSGQISGPIAVLLVLIMLALTEAWQPLPAAWRRLTACRVAAHRINDLAQPVDKLTAQANTDLPPDKHSLEFVDVSYRYRPGLHYVFNGLHLKIAPEEHIAVTGPTGGGKTTLALLIMGQLRPESGQVLYGGVNLQQIAPDALRRAIGYLPQRAPMFRDSLASNLRLARPTASDAELKQVLEAVGLTELLQRLPEGLGTWLGESGTRVSGGELRRVALARLMLTNPHIVILDEPTTGLDSDSARRMIHGLEKWLAGRTAIMISHDECLLPRFDRILHIGEIPKTN